MNPTDKRQAFALPPLDEALGGGLRPGTLTVIAGATGAGKTQLGLQWAAAGLAAEGRRGVVLDVTSRGDSQNHEDYARSQHRWELRQSALETGSGESEIWRQHGELLRPFTGIKRRVSRSDMDADEWDAWKRDLARVLPAGGRFLYAHFSAGVRRVVADGFEPVGQQSESIQLELFEYLYGQVVQQESEWAAREVLRERYRAHEAEVKARSYDHGDVGTLALLTVSELSLDELMMKPIGQGNLLATANTVILLGRTRAANGSGRGLFILKHRGSTCSDQILRFSIGDRGLQFEGEGGPK